MLGTSPGFTVSASAPLTRVRGARLTSPPTGVIEVDWSNPITEGMTHFAHPMLHRIVGPRLDTPQGPAFGASERRPTPGFARLGSGAPFVRGLSMFAMVWRRASTDGWGPNIRTDNVNASGVGIGFSGYQAHRQLRFAVSRGNFAGSIEVVSSTTLLSATYGDVVTMGGTFLRNTTGGIRLFCNGALVGSGDAIDTDLFSNGGHDFYANDRGGTATLENGTPVITSLFWARSLSEAEMLDLTRRPWQVFKYPDHFVWGAA